MAEEISELDAEMSFESPERRLGGVSPPASLKRVLSDTSLEHHQDNSRKRVKAQTDEGPSSSNGANATGDGGGLPIDGKALSDDLAQELQCGCCSELVYRPVVVSPCQHFFCGRYAPISQNQRCSDG